MSAPFTPQSARVWAVEQILSRRSRIDSKPLNLKEAKELCEAARVMAKFVLEAKGEQPASDASHASGDGPQ